MSALPQGREDLLWSVDISATLPGRHNLALTDARVARGEVEISSQVRESFASALFSQ